MMVFKSKNLLPFVAIIFLWRLCKIKAYVDVCESTVFNVYCNCEDLSYRDSSSLSRVSCVIFQPTTINDPIWRSLGNSERISYLKLQPRHPVELDYIPSDDLSRMPNLKVLKIQEGSLGILNSYALSGFQNLEELELEGNEIKSLEPNSISDMPRLKKLILSENSLEELLADSLSGLLELELLFLDRNNISRIETCAFCNLQNLKELELWSNEISDLTEYSFRGLRYLKRLDLYKNKIRILNDKVFHTMPRLFEIDLSDNMISHIAARAFVGLEKLQRLVMRNNKIKYLPNEVFAPLLSVRLVNLYHNKLETLPREVVDNIKNAKDEFFNLEFNENPYRCDCSMQWVPIYLNLSKSHRFTRELERVECEKEGFDLENVTKLIVVEYIKTAGCKSSTIKPRTPVVITEVYSEVYLATDPGNGASVVNSCFIVCVVLLTLLFSSTRSRRDM